MDTQCQHCGQQNTDPSSHCFHCGHPREATAATHTPSTQTSDGFAQTAVYDAKKPADAPQAPAVEIPGVDISAAGISKAAPQTPAGFPQAPAGFPQAPAGFPQASAGFPQAPAGFSMMGDLPTPSALEEVPSEDPLLGLQLGNFVLQEKIGEGGYGVVYRAEQIYLKQPFAIKLLHLSTRAAPEVIERFRREALAIAKLRHAHVVQLADFGMLPEERGFYLVMELLEGQSLADALAAQESFSMDRIISIIQQLCEVLHEAHTLGIFHRDLKPANIFLMPHRHGHDVIKLLDFGIASMLQEKVTLTQTATVLGSPAYMSPEQSQGHASSLDGRSDLYSLGVILYELLTGRMPFVAETLTGMLFQHAFEPPPHLNHARPGQAWAPQVEAFIARALAKSPDDRPQDADAFAAECTAALQAQRQMQEGKAVPIAVDETAPKEHTPASLPAQYSATQSTAPPKRPWGLVFVALLLLAGAGGYVAWEGQSNRKGLLSSDSPQPNRIKPRVVTAHSTQGSQQPQQSRSTRADQRPADIHPQAAPKGAGTPQPGTPSRGRASAPKRSRPLRRKRRHVRHRQGARRRTTVQKPDRPGTRNPKHIQQHLDNLGHPKKQVRTNAVRFLIRAGSSVVPALLQILRNGPKTAKKEAVYALGSIRDPRAVQPLLQEYTKQGQSYTMRLELTQAIQRMGPRAVPMLSKALQTAPKSHQPRLIAMLLRCGASGLPAIIRVLPSQTTAQQVSIIRSLGLHRRAKQLVVPALLQVIQSHKVPIRAEAAKSLGYIQGQPHEVIPVLLRTLQDRSAQVRYAAIHALGSYKRYATQFEFALLLSLQQRPLKNQLKALRVLEYCSTRSERTTREIARLLESPERKLRIKAIHVLGIFSNTQPAAISHIKQATQSQYADTRKSAQRTLGKLNNR